MSFLASEKTENTALHILIFFLIKTFFKYLERGYQKKKKSIMQVCSQSYSQVRLLGLNKKTLNI